MEIAWTEKEHREITAAAASRGVTFAQFVRDAAIVSLVTPTRTKTTRNLRPGGSKWLWGRVREEIQLWSQAGCEGKFQPLHPMNLYVKEITNKISGTHLNSGEAEDLLRDFIHREGPKIDRLVKKARDHWTRQNKGRVSNDSETEENDQTESID